MNSDAPFIAGLTVDSVKLCTSITRFQNIAGLIANSVAYLHSHVKQVDVNKNFLTMDCNLLFLVLAEQSNRILINLRDLSSL